MFMPAEGDSGRDTVQLYAFVLEKTRQHFVFYNFHEREMPLHILDFSDHQKKIFMHGPVVQPQLLCAESWLACHHFIIKEQGSVCSKALAHTLKILDNLFHEVLYAENYVLKISSYGLEEHAQDELRYLLGALSVNHTLVLSESPECNDNGIVAFEFNSWRPDGSTYIFCHGVLDKQTGLIADIAMLKLINLVAKKSEKFPLPLAPLLHVIVPLTEQQKMLALTLSHELQKHAYATDVHLQQADFDEHLHRARLVGARYVLAIGPDEQANGTVRINDLCKQTSTAVAHEDVLTFLGGQRTAI